MDFFIFSLKTAKNYGVGVDDGFEVSVFVTVDELVGVGVNVLVAVTEGVNVFVDVAVLLGVWVIVNVKVGVEVSVGGGVSVGGARYSSASALQSVGTTRVGNANNASKASFATAY